VSIAPAKLRRQVHKRFASSIRSRSVVTSIWIGFVLLIISGCGAPGEPVPPTPPVAVAIGDLTAHQAGDGVQLTFTMPGRSITGDRLLSTPAVEVLRGAAKPDGSPDLKSLRVVDTIPGALAERYFVGDRVQFTDPLTPEETKAQESKTAIYTVRTRLSQKRASANSNIVSLRLFPVPARVASVDARVTETAIELSWAAVNRTSAGDPLTVPAHYNIYRAELDDASTNLAGHDVSQLNLNGKLQLLASQPQQSYSDKAFEFGKTYAYIVRSVLDRDGVAPESADSTPIIVAPRDIFPPAVPQAISAAVVPGEADNALVVDLSWSINVEPDFVGYRVYRSEQPGTKGQLLTQELLPTPAYRDTSVQPARRYWYVVTAVDRAGNESAPSPPALVEIAQPLQ
jgi:fibronectin type 3 domain-containing protein